jgi:hypothetical protein
VADLALLSHRAFRDDLCNNGIDLCKLWRIIAVSDRGKFKCGWSDGLDGGWQGKLQLKFFDPEIFIGSLARP